MISLLTPSRHPEIYLRHGRDAPERRRRRANRAAVAEIAANAEALDSGPRLRALLQVPAFGEDAEHRIEQRRHPLLFRAIDELLAQHRRSRNAACIFFGRDRGVGRCRVKFRAR